MDTVFGLFKEIEYGYVKLNRGTVFGNQQDGEARILKGIFKLRRGYTRTGQNMENFNGEIPTLHAHPEDFDSTDPIVGNGVIINGIQYEVKGITKGTNFNTGVVEHITMSLQEVDYANI